MLENQHDGKVSRAELEGLSALTRDDLTIHFGIQPNSPRTKSNHSQNFGIYRELKSSYEKKKDVVIACC